MKIISFTPILLLSIAAHSQIWSGHIIDKETNSPISFVNITYKKSGIFSFSDTNGIFYINRSLISTDDTVSFNHIGYEKVLIPLADLLNQKKINLIRIVKELAPIEVTNCLNFKTIYFNRKEKAETFYGVEPGLNMIFIGAYENKETRKGFLKQVSYFVAPFSGDIHVPIRLHWYEWDGINKTIGKELTDTSIMHYPTRKRWNNISLPEKLISISNEKFVIGIEFMYPAEIQKEYWEADKERRKWIWDNKHWSMGMIKSSNESFYGMGSKIVKTQHVKPALRFKVKVCE